MKGKSIWDLSFNSERLQSVHSNCEIKRMSMRRWPCQLTHAIRARQDRYLNSRYCNLRASKNMSVTAKSVKPSRCELPAFEEPIALWACMCWLRQQEGSCSPMFKMICYEHVLTLSTTLRVLAPRRSSVKLEMICYEHVLTLSTTLRVLAPRRSSVKLEMIVLWACVDFVDDVTGSCSPKIICYHLMSMYVLTSSTWGFLLP